MMYRVSCQLVKTVPRAVNKKKPSTMHTHAHTYIAHAHPQDHAAIHADMQTDMPLAHVARENMALANMARAHMPPLLTCAHLSVLVEDDHAEACMRVRVRASVRACTW